MEEKIINLEEFAGGALAEKFNSEFQRILNNIYDPNTDSSKARILEVKIKFTPNSRRDGATIVVQATSKLAPVMAVETSIGIGQDNTGKVIAAEYKNQLAGQLGMQVDETTGEILTAPNDNVLDLRKTTSK